MDPYLFEWTFLYIIKISNSAWNYWILQLFWLKINKFIIILLIWLPISLHSTYMTLKWKLLYKYTWRWAICFRSRIPFMWIKVYFHKTSNSLSVWLHDCTSLLGKWILSHSLQISSAFLLHQHHVPCN